MPLNWSHHQVTTLSQADGTQVKTEIDYGTDDTGRIFGEVRTESPVFIAFHLRKIVGRYLSCEQAKTAIQNVHNLLQENKDD